MNKKTIILLVVAIVLAGIGFKVFFSKQTPLSNPSSSQKTQAINAAPSKTLKTYSDPSGFSFNYPDNLSVLNNELKDANSYAELQLTSKEVSGNLLLNITDSKYKTIEDWTKTFPDKTSKEVTLGNLKAKEIESDGKILLGALDSGIFFNIEVNPSGKKDFWMDVYSSVLKDFAFSAPEASTGSNVSASSDDVSFDGEEVLE